MEDIDENDQLEVNPFIATPFQINAIYKLKALGYVSGGQNYQIRKLETDERVTVYTEHILLWFSSLPSSAKDMFMYIASRLRYESDVIEIREDYYIKHMNVVRSTFFAAKTALTGKLIMPRDKRKNTYWVNPGFLFKGSRLSKYEDLIVMTNKHPLEGKTDAE